MADHAGIGAAVRGAAQQRAAPAQAAKLAVPAGGCRLLAGLRTGAGRGRPGSGAPAAGAASPRPQRLAAVLGVPWLALSLAALAREQPAMNVNHHGQQARVADRLAVD